MPLSLRVYVGGLAVILVAALAAVTIQGEFPSPLWVWALFAVFLALTEYADFNFNDEHARIGLSAAEAVLVPMLFALSFEQLVWAATIAVALREIRRIASIKGIFNIAEFGCAAASAGLVYRFLGDGTGAFTPRNALAAAGAVVSFSVLTHLFTSGAIALAERRSFFELSRAATPATFTSVAGSIVLGWVFASAYLAAPWTIVLLPLIIGIFFIGYRAMLSQSRERERVEHVHAASRALAASPGLESAVAGFLKAVREVASASEARVVLTSKGRPLPGGAHRVWSGVRMGQVTASMEPLEDGPMADLCAAVESSSGHLLLTDDGAGPPSQVLRELGASSLVSVPLLAAERNAGVGGYLMVMNRLGADEFADSDAHLLAALADELVVTIDSHRLFEEVSEERERFRRIFQGSEDGICMLDSTGAVLAWNPAMERITGYAATSVLGHVWSEKVTIRDEHQSRVEKLALVERSSDSELEVVTRDGPTRWISVLASSVRDRGGMAWVVLVRDVSAEHEVEAAKSDFLSTISHELRTPLTSIKGSLQVLGRGLDALPNDVADQMISVTSRGAERLERLVMNLLVVSQLDSGTMAVFPDEVSLNDVVLDRVEALLFDHPTKSVDLPDEPIVVRADRERVAHVLEHLLENARKFGGPHGTIVVSARLDSGYARVSVSDEGPGIPEADRERVFERFVRLGNILTRETQGAGVGLFIAKRSVEAMGGHISVDSEPGKGSTFTMMLPLAKPMVLSAGAGSG